MHLELRNQRLREAKEMGLVPASAGHISQGIPGSGVLTEMFSQPRWPSNEGWVLVGHCSPLISPNPPQLVSQALCGKLSIRLLKRTPTEWADVTFTHVSLGIRDQGLAHNAVILATVMATVMAIVIHF